MNPFFISTPIYYVNARPHLGHAYTTIIADSISRMHRLHNQDTYFLTGTDEHGDKIVEAAAKNSQTPGEYVDRISSLFRNTWPGLEVVPDNFIRTTDARHKKCVQDILQRVYDKGDIYFGEYGGHYCFGCERFYTEKELKDGLCPDHLEKPKFIQEKNYFFRMTKYIGPLKEHILSNPDFIRPERYRNEVLGMLGEELNDLCISRPKTRLTWGIELPFDNEYVTYVWFDALINYISALGWPDGSDFKKFWPGAHHLVAKDILKPHAVFWPTMLMSAEIPLYKSLRVHGYWTVKETKMSKSLGNVVEPMAMKDKYGLPAFRYFLLREMQFGLDASFSEEALVGRLNADLANDLGNLFNRVLSMTHKYFQGIVPAVDKVWEEVDQETMALGRECLKDYNDLFGQFDFAKALSRLWVFVSHLNKYVDQSAPWVLYKEKNLDRLGTVMYLLLEGMRKIALHLWPVMPGASEEMLSQLGVEFDLDKVELVREIDDWSGLNSGTAVAKTSNIFPRVDLSPAEPVTEEKKDKAGQENKEPEVQFEDFQKMKIVTGTILEAGKVEGADRLLRLMVDIGEESPRQIVAGLADYFSPDELVKREVIVLANLAPKKIRGVMSKGMVLAVRHGKKMSLLKAEPGVKPGRKVS